MAKVNDLQEVRVLPVSQIGYIEGNDQSWKGKAIVLHIVEKTGIEKTAVSSYNRYGATKCNRALLWPTVYSSPSLSTDDQDYKLCSRCGTEADFEKVFSEWHDWRVQEEKKLDIIAVGRRGNNSTTS